MGDEQGRFYTVRGYELIGQEDKILTSSMEDYLEMICRKGKNTGVCRKMAIGIHAGSHHT